MKTPGWLTIIFVLIGLTIGNFIQTGYYIIKPGSAESLGERVHVEGRVRVEEGQFYMVTVAQQKANLWQYLYAIINPALDLRHVSYVIPPGISYEEYEEILQSWMQDSKYLAQVIALQRAGYEITIISDGVEVKDIIPGSPAEGILEAGDIIKAVENENVYLAEEVVNKIQAKEIGQSVNLSIQRGNTLMDIEVQTTSHLEQTEKAALRIYVSTLNWQPLLPLKVDIETGPVVGPSAGVMFVLEILDRLVPENLTGGRKIAGTGTIDLEGAIGSIGGVKQKVIAAEQMGIEYFLTPEDNYLEAVHAARGITIIPVRNLDDLLASLHEL